MKNFWKWKDSVDGNDSELILDGVIANETWWGDEVTPQAFRDELKQHTGKNLTVVLNSPGGDVFAGVSIYNALRELDQNITVRVDGLAASIASVIAMAGDEIIMSPGSMMMIHRPSTVIAGNIDDMKKAEEVLQTIEDSIVPIYVKQTGKSSDEITEMMLNETYMTAEEAVREGFADKLADDQSDSTEPQPAMRMAFSMKATRESLQSFMDKIAADATKDEETETVDDTIEDESEEKVEEKVDEPKKSEEVETEDEIVEEKNNKEEIEMNPNDKKDEIIKDQVIEPKDQATVTVKANVDYLKSKQSLVDYANILVKNAGGEASDVLTDWKQNLEVKMGITNPEILLPSAIITSIEDAFAQYGQIWNLVNKTGLDVLHVGHDTTTGEDSRGKGHIRGHDKGEESITLADRVLRPKFIYKYLTLNKEDLRENKSTAALLTYVLSELPKRVVRELDRAILIGDGRAADSEYKINSFTSVKEDAEANGWYGSTYTPVAGDSLYETILKANDTIKQGGTKYLIAKQGFSTKVKTQKVVGGDGHFVLPVGVDLPSLLGVAGIIEPDWFDNTSDADNDAYVFIPDNYKTVGDSSVESFTNFLLKSNKQEYLQEIYAGGGQTARKTCVAIPANAES